MFSFFGALPKVGGESEVQYVVFIIILSLRRWGEPCGSSAMSLANDHPCGQQAVEAANSGLAMRSSAASAPFTTTAH